MQDAGDGHHLQVSVVEAGGLEGTVERREGEREGGREGGKEGRKRTVSACKALSMATGKTASPSPPPSARSSLPPNPPIHPLPHRVLGPQLHAAGVRVDVQDDKALCLRRQGHLLPVAPQLHLLRQVLAGPDEEVTEAHQGVVEFVQGRGEKEVGRAVAKLVEVEGDLE